MVVCSNEERCKHVSGLCVARVHEGRGAQDAQAEAKPTHIVGMAWPATSAEVALPGAGVS